MDRPDVGLSLMLEADFAAAALPLLAGDEVDVLEWSFDIGWGPDGLPDWAAELLDHYSQGGRLLGHGVTFSPLSGHWAQRQQQWLDRLARECEQRRYRHISEHFGFMTAGDFHRSAPLPVPLCEATVRIGRERLRRLADVARVPVGLENLAFAFGPQDFRDQGVFLEQLLGEVDGFLLLDLHNVYCQLCNFGQSVDQLLDSYPLDRVRELHVSGGSWSESTTEGGGRVRRDTHDEAVPDEVFELVRWALARCPAVEAVILERLGDTLRAADAEGFQNDFRRLRQLVREPTDARR
jgi:uncharacterized protein (UPF0276 family)